MATRLQQPIRIFYNHDGVKEGREMRFLHSELGSLILQIFQGEDFLGTLLPQHILVQFSIKGVQKARILSKYAKHEQLNIMKALSKSQYTASVESSRDEETKQEHFVCAILAKV